MNTSIFGVFFRPLLTLGFGGCSPSNGEAQLRVLDTYQSRTGETDAADGGPRVVVDAYAGQDAPETAEVSPQSSDYFAPDANDGETSSTEIGGEDAYRGSDLDAIDGAADDVALPETTPEQAPDTGEEPTPETDGSPPAICEQLAEMDATSLDACTADNMTVCNNAGCSIEIPDRVRLTIPPGALKEATCITIQSVPLDAECPGIFRLHNHFSKQVFAQVRLGPAPIAFSPCDTGAADLTAITGCALLAFSWPDLDNDGFVDSDTSPPSWSATLYEQYLAVAQIVGQGEPMALIGCMCFSDIWDDPQGGCTAFPEPNGNDCNPSNIAGTLPDGSALPPDTFRVSIQSFSTPGN